MYNSYKLTVNTYDANKVMSTDIWSQGVCISKWRNRGRACLNRDSRSDRNG